jgi:C2 domain
LTSGPDVRIKTSKIDDNNNPIFHEYLDVPAVETYSGEDTMPPFVLDIYDKDKFSDDFIGRSVIYVDEASIGNDLVIPRPKWHPVRVLPGAPP